MKYMFGILGVFIVVALACKKPAPPTEPNPPTPSASVKVTVKHVIQWQPYRIDSLVPNADVTLYIDERDRLDEVNAYITGTTDTAGVVWFDGLKEDLYYLAIRHDSLGYEEDWVSTPPGTLSLVEILYY